MDLRVLKVHHKLAVLGTPLKIYKAGWLSLERP